MHNQAAQHLGLQAQLKPEYPAYITYESLKSRPSVVDQKFEAQLILEEGKLWYPKVEVLEPYFPSEAASITFGAARVA